MNGCCFGSDSEPLAAVFGCQFLQVTFLVVFGLEKGCFRSPLFREKTATHFKRNLGWKLSRAPISIKCETKAPKRKHFS